MTCNKCNKNSTLCGCSDSYLTTNPNSLNSTLCPEPIPCDEYISAACNYINDGIYDAALPPKTSIEKVIQQLILMITNPECTNTDSCNCPGTGPGSGTVTNVDATINGNAIAIAGVPITTSGSIDFTWEGGSTEYVRGDGTLATFPVIPVYSVINGLNENPAGTFKLGGNLIENTTMTAGIFRFLITGSNSDPTNFGVFVVRNTSTSNGVGIVASSTGTGTGATAGYFTTNNQARATIVAETTGANTLSGIESRYTATASADTQQAILANATNVNGPVALVAQTAQVGLRPAIYAIKDYSGTNYNTVQNVIAVVTKGNGQIGGGSAIYYEHVGNSGLTTVTTNRLESVWKNPTPGAYNSTLRVTGTNIAGTGQNILVEMDSDTTTGFMMRFINALPTSSSGLAAGSLYTQTSTEIGGSGTQKVICIV